jgi:hypothetical protein
MQLEGCPGIRLYRNVGTLPGKNSFNPSDYTYVESKNTAC